MKHVTILTAALGLMLWPVRGECQSIDEILAEFAAEPTILEVQEAVMEYNHIDQDEMGSWATRATASRALPFLRVDYRLQMEDDEQNDTDRSFDVENNIETLTDVDRDQRIENDDRTRLWLRGEWELGELVYNHDLIRVAGERSDLVELREDILTTVTSLYFERRRAQVQMVLDPPSDAVERVRRELEIQELTAGIDALTGGWFSARLSGAGLPSY